MQAVWNQVRSGDLCSYDKPVWEVCSTIQALQAQATLTVTYEARSLLGGGGGVQ